MKKLSFIAIILVLSMLLMALVGCVGTDDGAADDGDNDVTDGGDANTDDSSDSSDEGVGGDDVEAAVFEEGLFVNIDLNSVTFPFLESLANMKKLPLTRLYPFVDQYVDGGVTDLSFNIFTQISLTPSDVWMTVVDKYLQTEENGKPVDYTKNFKGPYSVLETHGVDFMEVWINRCHTVGITPWLNIRMNDCHQGAAGEPYFLYDDFFYEADHLPKSYGYYSNCYDYADERVRGRMLRYIEEQLMRYDANLELDFSREMYCFDYKNNPECHLIMTEFLRDVNEIVEKAEEKWGHDIKVMIRLIRDIEQNKKMGFDVQTMADEKLVDIVCPTARWSTTDSDMPIAEWVERFPTLDIYAGLENFTLSKGSDPATVYGYAANYLAQGADRIYLYNWYLDPNSSNVGLLSMFENCTSPDKLIDLAKRYVVTYQDICPDGFTAFNPLPAIFMGKATLDIGTGTIKKGAEAYIYVSVDETIMYEMGEGELIISVNGVKCVYLGEAKAPGNDYSGKKLYKYKVNADLSEKTTHTLEFSGRKDSSIVALTYIELNVLG